MFRYIFGPVPSRRLGMSLGVDLVPKKVCSLNCVYCEVGTTTKLTTKRMEYVPYEKVIQELEEYMEHNIDPDFITLSGYGEPMLNSRAGDVINFIKQNYPYLKVAVLTNGTLLYDKNVRAELLNADVILPSLDAATEKAFKKINRPYQSLKVEDHIEGLINLRKEFNGEMWLELFILPGYNDSDRDIAALKQAIEIISPNRLQINTLDRPGTIEGIRPALAEELVEIKNKLNFRNTEVVAATPVKEESKAYREDTENAILDTIARRPCTVQDLRALLGIHIQAVNQYLEVLEAKGKITTEIKERGIFYRTK
ncbi:MAG TPA: radical SAM protein [Salinivirga sp.]|uniref:radical SAM protein n=1 Tax=Salinivirga sp. TaxID=1970192 RepID=UPI002B45BB10|nr:radical SAM protein [Salinivirga sp.]HKK59311.1 radical SAM protein [Salinivirga sp.]